MARTKASVGAKVSFGKSSKAQRVNVQPSSSGRSKGSSSKNSSSGGNPYCPRETPNWQLPITRFFCENQISKTNNASSSNSSLVKNNNNNDSEVDLDVENSVKTPIEKPDISECHNSDDDNELDTTCVSESELLPLVDDESSHKIGEYFDTVENKKCSTFGTIKVKISAKNKGKGKSSKSKHNSIAEDVIMMDDIEVIDEKENTNPQKNDEMTGNESLPKKRMIDDCMDGNDEVNSFKRIKIST